MTTPTPPPQQPSSTSSPQLHTKNAQHLAGAADCLNRTASSLEAYDDAEELLTEAEALLEDGPEWALLVLSRQNPIRHAAAAVVTNTWFERLILLLILANCVTLAMYSHQPGFDNTQLGVALGYTEWVFAACFSLELLLKVLAMGLVWQPGTYLRDGWNLLDAAVVVLGWLDIALSGEQYTFLRIVRVLRPLRTITHIRGLKVPVATLAKALPMLLDVLALCLFAFFVFGVVAVQLFAGVLKNRCAAADFSSAYLVPASAGGQQTYANVTYVQPADGSIQQCSGYLTADIKWAFQQPQPEGINSSNSSSSGVPAWSGGSTGGGWSCDTQPQQQLDAPYGTFCAAFGNPGMTSFDNIVWAWATIFQCVTTEGWTDIMYALQDAVSPWVLVYFLLLIIFASFFLVNLALAVLYLQFTKEFSLSPAASRAASRRSSRAVSSRCNSFAAGRLNFLLQQGGAGNVKQERAQHGAQDGSAGVMSMNGTGSGTNRTHEQQERQQQRAQQQQVSGASVWQGKQSHEQRCEEQLPGNCGGPETEDEAAGCVQLAAKPQTLPPVRVTWNSLSGSKGEASADGADSEPEHATARVTIRQPVTASKGKPGASTEQGSVVGTANSPQQSPRAILKHGPPSQQPGRLQELGSSNGSASSSWLLCVRQQLRRCCGLFMTAWELLRRKCRNLIKGGWLEIVSLVVIITNTAVMASQSWPINPQWSVASDYLNVAFSCYFVLELTIKLLGAGVRPFLRDRMNQFDALVVAASLVEVAMFLMPGDNTNSNSLSVLRTARLLRVFKLARSWAELNRIITTILRSFGQVVYLSMLLVLFMFVFALMGMQLFGYKFSRCNLEGAQQLCLPGTPAAECPAYPDCYVSCLDSQAFTWINVTGSPYNDLAYCEQFPRNSSYWGNTTAAAEAAAAAPAGTFQYWAQVGKAVVPDSRFDNIGWALVTVFQIITTENWNNVAYDAMSATSPAAYLWFVAIIVLGNYILLNLFLAILLENFGSSSSNSSGGMSSANSTGGTLAAAANVAQMLAWMQDLVEASWFARMLHRRRNNRVAALQGPDEAEEGEVGSVEAQAAAAGYDESVRPRVSVAFQGSDSAADGSPRGNAALLGVGGGGDGGDAPWGYGPKSSVSGSYPVTAARRSFTPLIAPSSRSPDNLQALAGAARQSSFLAPRSHSVTGLVPGGIATVSRSAQSCTVASCDGWRPAAGPVAARAAPGVGVLSGVGNTSSHRLASMAGAGAVDVDQQQVRAGGAFKQQPPGSAHPGANRGPDMQPAGPDSVQACPQLDALRRHSNNLQQQPEASGLTQTRPLSGRSCCLLGPNNWLRVQLHRLLCHPYFENTVLVLIFASSVALALDMPDLDPLGTFKRVLEAFDCVFALLFLLEAAVKVLVHGFVFNGRGSYLRNPWNVLDFAIVVIGIVVMGTTLSGLQRHQSLSSLKALRTLRALRPLRVASRLSGMKVVVNSLFASLPALGNVLLVCLLFYLIFGIMAVDLLGGAMYSCQDPSGQLYDSDYVLPPGQHINRDWCVNSSLQVTESAYHAGINVSVPAYTPAREWVKPLANYDNIALATLTLWQISTTELWVNTMYAAIAAVDVDQQPRAGHNPALALFFIAFIVFGGFFVLQLFVSVTIEKFSEMHQQQGKSALLTPQQEGWLRIEKMMASVDLQVKHLPPRQRWRAAVFKAVESRHFELAAMLAIVLNCVVMAMTHADMDSAWQDFMTWANTGFTAFFTLEILVKFVAWGFKPVVMDPWCRFDIVVVAVSIIGVGIDLGTPSNLQFLPLLRVLRVVRIFRLVPKAEGLKVLLRTLFMSLPALGNIVSVLGLFFFIYSVIGMNLFGAIKHGQYLTRLANFHHVGMALLTLFRMITGESWNGLMQDCMLTSMCMEVLQDVTVAGADGGGGSSSSIAAGSWLNPGDPALASIPPDAVINRCSPSPIAAVAFFCSFVLLCGLVLVNFVIAVIIDNFQSSCQTDDLPVSKASVDEFSGVWTELDPQATHFIPAIQLSTLLQELRPPLGVKGEEDSRAKIQGIVMNVDIPVRNGKIHFLETLHALAGRIAGTSVPDEEEHKVREMLYPRLPSKDASDLPKYGVSHFYAALYVQAAMRGFLKRHALKDGGGSFSTEQQEQQQQRQCRRQSTLQRLFRLSSTGSRKQHGEQTAVQLELPPAEMRTLSDGQQP